MIGIFDSGFGGLSILNQLEKDLPQFEYFYYGDNINAPYGNKTEEEIYKLTISALNFIFNKGAILVIVACNTVSARVLRRIQKEFTDNGENKKILGIIIPNIEYISSLPKKTRIGVIGTTHTIKSKKYLYEIHKRRPDLKIFTKDCPKFAGFIEKGKSKSLESLTNIKEELSFFANKNISFLFLACTHYHFIKDEIKKNISSNVQVMDTVEIISKKTEDYLTKHKELKIKLSRNTYFYSSGKSNTIRKITLDLYKNKPNRSFKILK